MYKGIKTYSRKNKDDSISKRSVKARSVIDALFAVNITKRNLSSSHTSKKKKHKLRLKPLPLPTSENAFINDSFNYVKSNDTFDRLFERDLYKKKTVAIANDDDDEDDDDCWEYVISESEPKADVKNKTDEKKKDTGYTKRPLRRRTNKKRKAYVSTDRFAKHLAEPVEESLVIEKMCPPKVCHNYSDALSELSSLTNNKLTNSVPFNKLQISAIGKCDDDVSLFVPATEAKTIQCSTPNRTLQHPTLQTSISPITLFMRTNNFNPRTIDALKDSYVEILEWGRKYPVETPKNRKTLVRRKLLNGSGRFRTNGFQKANCSSSSASRRTTNGKYNNKSNTTSTTNRNNRSMHSSFRNRILTPERSLNFAGFTRSEINDDSTPSSIFDSKLRCMPIVLLRNIMPRAAKADARTNPPISLSSPEIKPKTCRAVQELLNSDNKLQLKAVVVLERFLDIIGIDSRFSTASARQRVAKTNVAANKKRLSNVARVPDAVVADSPLDRSNDRAENVIVISDSDSDDSVKELFLSLTDSEQSFNDDNDDDDEISSSFTKPPIKICPLSDRFVTTKRGGAAYVGSPTICTLQEKLQHALTDSTATGVNDNGVFVVPNVPPIDEYKFMKRSSTRRCTTVDEAFNDYLMSDTKMSLGCTLRDGDNYDGSGETKNETLCNDVWPKDDVSAMIVQRYSVIDSLASKTFRTDEFLPCRGGKKWRKSLQISRLTRNSTSIKSERTPIRFSTRIIPEKNESARSSGVPTPLARYASLCYLSKQKENTEDGSDHLEDHLNELSLNTKKKRKTKFSARNLVLLRCGQSAPIPFSQCYQDVDLVNCRKIGEGVYGEVFILNDSNGPSTVMKIIPIEGELLVNGERQKKFDEILSEIVIASELSALRRNDGKGNCTDGFSEVRRVRCVRGKYPDQLIDLWELWDERHNSENDNPNIFDDEQLYVVLELANGGKDLESFHFQNAKQALALFMQAACTLAVGEKSLQFEHRDLHWGNILIQTTKDLSVNFTLDGHDMNIKSGGVKISIIDFTLSRISHDGCCLYNDLALDPDLFIGTGDYQFDIYRLMQKSTRNNWQVFEPYTNILWLHYILEKMITQLRYKKTDTKVHRDGLETLMEFKGELLKFNNVVDFVTAKIIY